MDIVAKIIQNVLKALYQPFWFSVLLSVLAMFFIMFSKEQGWKTLLKKWLRNFKSSVDFRKEFLLIFYTTMILFRTLLNRDMWANPLADVIGKWWIYDANGELTTEIFENTVLFIPFVILLLWTFKDKLIKNMKWHNVLWMSVKSVFLFSLAIEFLQLFLRLGTFQLSDLFYNTLGGVAGGIIYFIGHKIAEKKKGQRMKQIELTFLALLAKNLVCKEREVLLPSSIEEWNMLYRIAKTQKLWSIAFEEICSTPEYLSLPADLQMAWMQDAVSSSAGQIIQAKELCRICKVLSDEDIKYVVLKGITCRRYYPNPNSRPSGDEDIIIDWRDYKRCDELLVSNGYECENNYDFKDIENQREAHYIHKDGLLYLEVHFNAIGKSNQRQERLNASFEDVFDHTAVMDYEEYQLTVLEPTYQIMHLLSHLYRHLYECGVGVRQMLDVLMTLCAQSQNIDWNTLKKFLNETRMNKIFAAILNTGKRYFSMDLSFVPKMLWDEELDPEPLLEDMIDGGIYGYGEDNKRRLAENFTLNIDTNQSSALAVIFPPKSRLAGRYPVLNRHPVLYPALAVVRWFDILKDYGKDKESRSLLKERVKIGKERQSILEKYTD